jgi:hypothetical protein
MSDWYAPNQQAVRADESGPAEQGTGGSQPESPPEPEAKDRPAAERKGQPETKAEAESRERDAAKAKKTKAREDS